MDQSAYVVLFDGLSIPQDDVFTHDINASTQYKEDLFNSNNKQASENGDEFTKFLSREEAVLKEGFRSWCENEYLDESNFREESLNDSFDFTSYTRLTQRACGINLSEISKRENIVNMPNDFDEKQVESLTQTCSVNDSEQYWCRIDPTAFELKDMDYLRAKCRWQFKNVSDFETNPKAIEHMRYLDLFTQCFSLRLMHENACDQNKQESTCYNFQGTDPDNINVLCSDNYSYKNNFEYIPEKENTFKSQTKPVINPSFEENHVSRINYEENNVFSDGFDYTDTSSKEHIDGHNKFLLEKKHNRKSRMKNLTSSRDKINTLFDNLNLLNEKKSKTGLNNNNCKENVLINPKINENKYAGNESKNKDTNLNTNESKQKPSVDLKTENKKDDCFMESVKCNKNPNKNKDSANVDENDAISSLSAEPSSISSIAVNKENKYLLKTIHYKPTAKLESSTQSEAVSCESFFTKIVNNKLPEKKLFRKTAAAMKSKLPLKLGNSILSGIDQTGISENEQVTFTSSLLERFVNSKKRQENYNISPKLKIDETVDSSEQQDAFVLDSILQKSQSCVEDVDEQPIIIIGLKYEDHKQSISEESKAQARVRRYIQGDNLCKPGRYVSRHSKNTLPELEEESNFIYSKTPYNQNYHIVHGTFEVPKPLCYSHLTVESDLESELSNNVADQSLTDSDNSVATESSTDKNHKKNKYKKYKKYACRKCGKNESSLICTDNKHIWNGSKSSTPHVYVSCWKRFCVIL